MKGRNLQNIAHNVDVVDFSTNICERRLVQEFGYFFKEIFANLFCLLWILGKDFNDFLSVLIALGSILGNIESALEPVQVWLN
jgi:hypothetical protein